MKPAILLFVALGACKPGSTPEQVQRDTAPAVRPPEDAPATSECRTASCWQGRAAVAQRLGQGDVASAHRGRAFAVDPRPALLFPWIEGMITNGEHQAAREALTSARAAAQERGDSTLLAAIDERRFAFGETPRAPSLALDPADARLRAAYQAVADGRIAAATALFSAALGRDASPARLADAASMVATYAGPEPTLQAWLHGSWARARVLFREQGASLRMVPVETWMLDDAVWRAGQLVMSRNVEILDSYETRLGLIELRAPTHSAPIMQRFYPGNADAFALATDGTTLLRAGNDGALWQDQLLTGDAHLLVPPSQRLGQLITAGAGEGLRILAADGHGATLRDANGAVLAEYALDGTTPTITRVYTGEGSHHDNILRESPSWPVALALTDDAQWVGLGASDSRVHVFDRARGQQRVLTFKWTYEERRHMGGNPDLNLPLALRFASGGDELLAVYAHGDLIRWDTRRGTAKQHIPGTCDAHELDAVTNRFVSPGEPRQVPDADDRRGCGRAVTAAISADGRMVATGGVDAIRVRDAHSGARLALLTDITLPDQHLRFAADGTLAMLDLYGTVALWRPGSAVTVPIPPRASGPVSPTLTTDGRLLKFDVAGDPVVWDLVARRTLALRRDPQERVLALAPDGKRVALRVGSVVELRDMATGITRLRTPIPDGTAPEVQFAAGGHVLVDMKGGALRPIILIDPAGTARPLAILTTAHGLRLSDDGRWLASFGYQGPMEVWNTGDATLQHTFANDVRHVTFARDGRFVAWLEQPPGVPKVRARVQRLDAPGAGPTLDLEGYPHFIGATADGRELLILLANGELTRWRPGEGTHTRHKETWLIGRHSVHLADDGRTLLLAGYGNIEIRANDAGMTPLATLHALLGGDWMIISRAGAIDGSPAAVDHLVTRVSRGDETLIFTGLLGWDGAHVQGVLGRALAGEDVAPPVLVRP